MAGDKFANSPNLFSIGCNKESIKLVGAGLSVEVELVFSLGGAVEEAVAVEEAEEEAVAEVAVAGEAVAVVAVDISSICKEPKEQNDVTIGWGFLHISENLQ